MYGRPLPSEKIGEEVSVGKGATVHRLVSGHDRHVVRASLPGSRWRGKTPYRDIVGMAMSTAVSEKNREMLFIGKVFYKQ